MKDFLLNMLFVLRDYPLALAAMVMVFALLVAGWMHVSSLKAITKVATINRRKS